MDTPLFICLIDSFLGTSLKDGKKSVESLSEIQANEIQSGEKSQDPGSVDKIKEPTTTHMKVPSTAIPKAPIQQVPKHKKKVTRTDEPGEPEPRKLRPRSVINAKAIYKTYLFIEKIRFMGDFWFEIKDTKQRGRALRAIKDIPEEVYLTAMFGAKVGTIKKTDPRYNYVVKRGRSNFAPLLNRITAQNKDQDLRICAHLANHTSNMKLVNAKMESHHAPDWNNRKKWPTGKAPNLQKEQYVGHLVSSRVIYEGEEIRWNYGKEYILDPRWASTDLQTDWID